MRAVCGSERICLWPVSGARLHNAAEGVGAEAGPGVGDSTALLFNMI